MNTDLIYSAESVEELDELIKNAREYRRELKAKREKAEREQIAAEKELLNRKAQKNIEAMNLEEGDLVRFYLKGEERTGEFYKITESRFIVIVNGEKKTLPFDKFIGTAEQADVA